MVLKEIINRRSIREFKPNPVPDSTIQEIIKAAQFAPTSRNNRSTEFIIVKEQNAKQKLYKTAIPEQEFIKEAPVIIVPVTNPGKTNQPVQDLALATQNIFLQATKLGLGTVWKNLKPPVAAEIKKILSIPEQSMIINMIPLGYSKEPAKPHTEDDFELKRIHLEQW